MTGRSNAFMRASRAGICAFVLVSVSLGLAVTTAAGASASSGPCAAPIIGQARVVVVVDDGEGGPDHAVVTCVIVPRGTKGAQVLAARAAQLGTAVPSHAGSGLLCTIDSFPASQCAETGSGSYWANFSGTDGSWNYSTYNPFIRRVCDGDVEGWRYVVRGSGAAGDAQPRLDAATVRPADAWGCSEPTSAPTVGSGAGDSGNTTGSAASGSTVDPSAPVDGSNPSATDPVSPDPTASDSSAAGVTSGASGASDAVQRDASGDVVLASDSQANSEGTASWWGAGLALVIILLLGGAAVFRSRRRA
jgi:hypothetical protein